MIKWLFDISTLHLSTQNVTHDGAEYQAAIIPDTFSGITERWDIAGNGLIAPNDMEFEVSSKGGSIAKGDIEGEFCTVRLIIDEVEVRVWKFKISRAIDYYGKIKCYCVDFLHEYLSGDWPSTAHPHEIWPNDESSTDDNYCVPEVLGQAFIPLKSVNTGSERYYVLGEDAGTYDIQKVRSPHEWPNKSTWDSSEYTFSLSSSNGYRLLQPKIDERVDPPGTGLWPSGDRFLNMPTKFTNSITATITNPADWVSYILQSFGLDSDNIDTSSFTDSGNIYDSENIGFNGGFWQKESRESILSTLLLQTDSYLVCSDKVELYQFSNTSQESITKALLQSFAPSKITKSISDSIRVHWPESLDKPQDKLNGKKVVPTVTDGATDNIDSGEFRARFLCGQAENAQRAGMLHAQKKFEQLEKINFSVTLNSLSNKGLHPGQVVTVDNPLYGGTYDVIITEFTVQHNLQVNISAVRLRHMDSWLDITASDVTVIDDDTSGFSLIDAITEREQRNVDSPAGINTSPAPYQINLTFNYTKNSEFTALELWMASTNNRADAIHEADITGYSHSVTGLDIGTEKWFWTRIRDKYGNVSSWYPDSSTGVYGYAATDPQAYLDMLSGSLTETELYSGLNDRIDLIDTEFIHEDVYETETYAGMNGAFSGLFDIQQIFKTDLDLVEQATNENLNQISELQTEIAGLITTEWVSDQGWDSGRIVTHDNQTWQCVQTHSAPSPEPGTNEDYWVSIESISEQVSSIDSRVDTLEGEITTKVSQTDFDSLSNTVSTHDTEITQNANAITLKADQTDVDAFSAIIIPEYDSSSTYEKWSYVRKSGTVYKAKQEIDFTPAPDVSNTDYWELVSAISNEVTTALSEISVESDNITLLSQTITGPITFDGVYDDVFVEWGGDVENLDTRVKSASIEIDSQDSRITAAVADINNLDGRMASAESTLETKVNEDEALAIAQTQITAEYEGTSASVTDLSSVVSGVDTAKAQRTIRVNANDHVTGLVMIAGGDGEDKSQFVVQADVFQVVNSADSGDLATPFVVGTVNGVSTVGVDGNLVVDGTISAEKLVFTPTDESNVVSTINSSTEGLLISSDKITLAGDTTVEGDFEIDGGHLTAGSVTATAIDVTSLSAINANLGVVTAGVIRSPTWGSSSGMHIDLNKTWGEMHFGGYSSPAMWWNGSELQVKQMDFPSGANVDFRGSIKFYVDESPNTMRFINGYGDSGGKIFFDPQQTLEEPDGYFVIQSLYGGMQLGNSSNHLKIYGQGIRFDESEDLYIGGDVIDNHSFSLDLQANDKWELLYGLDDAFKHHDPNKAPSLLRYEKPKSFRKKSKPYGRKQIDYIQILIECMSEIKTEIEELKNGPKK